MTQQAHKLDEMSSEVIWVSIKNVIPNPLNPRSEDAIDTQTMQDIIQRRGWEEPLVAYKKGKMYVLLAGHRRLYAAKQAKVKQIPLYVRNAPKDQQDELERIASLQSGRVDWTPYEWARFTYDRWVAWGRPAKTAFAKQISLSPSSVANYIEVLDYFPSNEIAEGLQKKELTITTLAQLVKWMKALKKNKPELVEAMTEDMIRQIMILKIKEKKAQREDLKNTEYTRVADEDRIAEFLTSRSQELNFQLSYVGAKKKYRTFKGHLISIGHMENRIPHIKPETDLQREQAEESLLKMKKLIDDKLKELETSSDQNTELNTEDNEQNED